MTIESATFLNGLNASNPGANDQKSEGDDHLRLIKSTVKASFPNIAGAVSATDVQLSFVTGVTSAIQTQINTKAALGSNADITGVTVLTSINTGQIAGLRNKLINGAFGLNQRLLATNADDTYSHDGWNVLTQTGTVALSTLTDVENGLPRMARMTQSQAVAQRMGYSQIIGGRDCKDLRGKTVTFRLGRTRLSTTANVRHAVLEWTGTENAVTSDVVLDWTSAVYTAGNFFLAANLTVSGTVSQALTAATLADGSAVTVTLGSTFNNLIVFSWVEATAAQNVTLDLGRAQLEIGSVATVFEVLPDAQDLLLAQQYCNKSYNLSVAPGTVTSTGMVYIQRASATSADNTPLRFPVPMFAAPTVTTYSDVTGASGQVRNNATPADVASTISTAGENGCGVGFTFAVAGSPGSFHYLAVVEL